ncbi:putative mitochondrial outer membrane protein [Talaromyces pinophilus]|nr:putative mitochondrial outer membrane protein [Talaromyces pinophilus]
MSFIRHLTPSPTSTASFSSLLPPFHLLPYYVVDRKNTIKMTYLGPFHILSYGTLLGAQIYQSFIGGTTAYKALPRPQFSALQNKLFPIYFSLQAALPIALALTFPGKFGTSDLSSVYGVIAPENRFAVLLPLGSVSVAGLVNLLYLTPKVGRVIKERFLQESIDGKKAYDAPPHSQKMTELNKRFGKLHGVSSLLNMGALIATIAYGVYLGGRLH